MSQEVAGGGNALHPTSWSLRTATGDQEEGYGETVAIFHVGDTSFQHRVLVTNNNKDVILWVLTRFGFLLDLMNSVITISGEEVMLLRGNDLTVCVILNEEMTLRHVAMLL